MTVTLLMVQAAAAAADMATRAFVAQHVGQAFVWQRPGGAQPFTLEPVHPLTDMPGLAWARGGFARWTLAEFAFEYAQGRIRAVQS